ncbi:MAG: hypothetical protein IT292_01680 [Deltaproteobacteria bacterium]|nr:hypothetical protein [Deltaproteobacteria bacterium]
MSSGEPIYLKFMERNISSEKLDAYFDEELSLAETTAIKEALEADVGLHSEFNKMTWLSDNLKHWFECKWEKEAGVNYQASLWAKIETSLDEKSVRQADQSNAESILQLFVNYLVAPFKQWPITTTAFATFILTVLWLGTGRQQNPIASLLKESNQRSVRLTAASGLHTANLDVDWIESDGNISFINANTAEAPIIWVKKTR